jgi:hypothetical protein
VESRPSAASRKIVAVILQQRMSVRSNFKSSANDFEPTDVSGYNLTMERWSSRLRQRGISAHASALRISCKGLLSVHADLRIPLRKVRVRQRNPRPLQRLEGDRVPALRLKEIVQEIFRVRLGRDWWQ